MNDREQAILEFLRKSLPDMDESDLDLIMTGLLRAGERYDRYAANKEDWISYANRRRVLTKITEHAAELVESLRELDIISRDILEERLSIERLGTTISYLGYLEHESTKLAGGIQKEGRQIDLAEEIWVLEIAEIFENVFRRGASDSDSGSGRKKNRRPFFQLLRLSWPSSFPRYGKLNPRQIDRVLDRKNRKPRFIDHPKAIEFWGPQNSDKPTE